MKIINKLEKNLINFIEQNDYLTIDQFIEQVLSSNKQSYYKHQQSILGQYGDFITAPEVSQLFGEILGLWFIEQYYALGNKSRTIDIVELGPGRGYLMCDMLNTIKLVPEFYQNIKINLVEINKHLIKVQQDTLLNTSLEISWYNGVKELIDDLLVTGNNVIIIANEFFDALSIKQYVKVEQSWHEVVIKYFGTTFYLSTNPISFEKQEYLQIKYPHCKSGAVIEESITANPILRSLNSYISQFNGAMLIVDYGYHIKPLDRNTSNSISTLQAIKNHRYSSLFEDIGNADLSTQVDFFSLIEQIAYYKNITINPIISQRDFLLKYGILLRKELLQKNSNKELQYIIEQQVHRLIDTKQMGTLFKVLEFYKYD